MNFFIQSLFVAIPIFLILIGIEMIVAKRKGITVNRPEDMISSLSSGVTNITKDGLKFGVVLVSYPWLLDQLMLYKLEPVWAAVFVAFLVQDFTGYWMHRLNHRVNVFWNRHIIHHSSEEFNLSCALRQSISETFHFGAILMIPAAILGVPHKIFIILGPIHLFMQFWYHTRLIDKMGWLEKIIVTPSHHRVHHAINPEYIDKNYGQILIIWDKLFGSFQPELKSVPPVYGILRPANTWNPVIINFKHLWQLMKDAFYAKYLWDKIRIWFMPTGWRPDDVEVRFPLKTIDNPYSQIKYGSTNSPPLLIWGGAQMFISLLLMFVMFAESLELGQTITALLALFLMMNVFSYTSLMDGKKIAFGADIVKMVLIGSGIFLLRDEMIPMSITAFFLYGILSTFGTLYFMKKERKLLAI
jgi:sterol desaturase/sphingolipid hydroxylase (fatty acid hydroxylase superfamily)